MALAAGSRTGSYEILAVLGTGGMGAVPPRGNNRLACPKPSGAFREAVEPSGRIPPAPPSGAAPPRRVSAEASRRAEDEADYSVTVIHSFRTWPVDTVTRR
jgi:hypothetical protein